MKRYKIEYLFVTVQCVGGAVEASLSSAEAGQFGSAVGDERPERGVVAVTTSVRARQGPPSLPLKLRPVRAAAVAASTPGRAAAQRLLVAVHGRRRPAATGQSYSRRRNCCNNRREA